MQTQGYLIIMPKSNSLFLLIKAMTKAEKRHFKMYSSINAIDGDKDYIRLFDAMEAQEAYDEKALLEKFKNEPYFSQLNGVKFYLYRQIMKSLKIIQDDSSDNVKLQNYLAEIEILFGKKLFKNCATTIKKARIYAQKHENFLKLLEIMAWESKIATWNHDVDEVESLKREWKEEGHDVLKKYTEIFELKPLIYDITSFVLRKGHAKTDSEIHFIKNILSDKLLQDEKSSFNGELNRLVITSNCLGALGMEEERLLASKKMIALYDRFPGQLSLNNYFFNMLSHANLSLSLKKAIYSDLLVQKLTIVYENRCSELELKNKVGYLNIRSSFLLFQGQFREALNLLDNIDKLIEGRGGELDSNSELYLYELKFAVYFCNKEFKKSQHYVRKIINSKSGVRVDIQTSARIAYLIIQYEEREYSHLEYAWRSTYRYLLKKERLQEAENKVLHFLRNAIKFNSEKQILIALAEFKDLIRPYMDQFMVGFPLIEWIDSKIKNRDLQEIVQERYLAAIENEEQVKTG